MQKTSCWLWHAIDHDSGDVVVCVFGTCRSEVLGVFWVLLEGLVLNVVVVFFDGIFVYRGVVSIPVLCMGEWNM